MRVVLASVLGKQRRFELDERFDVCRGRFGDVDHTCDPRRGAVPSAAEVLSEPDSPIQPRLELFGIKRLGEWR